jgi:hypothetical protein
MPPLTSGRYQMVKILDSVVRIVFHGRSFATARKAAMSRREPIFLLVCRDDPERAVGQRLLQRECPRRTASKLGD